MRHHFPHERCKRTRPKCILNPALSCIGALPHIDLPSLPIVGKEVRAKPAAKNPDGRRHRDDGAIHSPCGLPLRWPL
jgi:hypothetical protein